MNKTFPCDQCSKSFLRNSHFKIHKRNQNGEKPFPCDQCPKSFTQDRHFKSHRHLHEETLYIIQSLFMEMYCTPVISVITRQNGKEFLKHIQNLFKEMCATLLISAITRRHGKEFLKRHLDSIHRDVWYTCNLCESVSF